MHTVKVAQAKSPGSGGSIFSTPLLACIYALIVSPLLLFFTFNPSLVRGLMENRIENRFFWPAVAGIAVIGVVRNLSRGIKVVWAPHILCLLAYLAFAGGSILWAFSPELSFIRFVQQVMIVTAVVLPATQAVRTGDLMHGLFLCFSLAVILNLLFVLGGYQTMAEKVSFGHVDRFSIGYSGYFFGKNYLGVCAATALLLSLHEFFYPGYRRAVGLAVVCGSILLIVVSSSKTALGLALLAPILAQVILTIRRTFRISPAVVILATIFIYFPISKYTGFNMSRVSYELYGDSTFTGRQIIWDYAKLEMANRPLLGWGYQSFWLVGPSGPSIVNAPGWVKTMPNAHNGYYDTRLEMGYVGLVLLTIFISVTLHGIGWVADRDRARAWVVLSVALFVMMHNGLETTWLHAFEFLWIVFLILAAEIARYWHPTYRSGPTMRRHPADNSRSARRASRDAEVS